MFHKKILILRQVSLDQSIVKSNQIWTIVYCCLLFYYFCLANFYVDFGTIQDGFEISVINMVGQVVKVEKSLQPAKGSNLNLDGKKPGLYLVKVNYPSGKTSELKIVIL